MKERNETMVAKTEAHNELNNIKKVNWSKLFKERKNKLNSRKKERNRIVKVN